MTTAECGVVRKSFWLLSQCNCNCDVSGHRNGTALDARLSATMTNPFLFASKRFRVPEVTDDSDFLATWRGHVGCPSRIKTRTSRLTSRYRHFEITGPPRLPTLERPVPNSL